jgi:hypothetical protein
VHWAPPHDVTPGEKDGVQYWDYWPEGFSLGDRLTLYYTSERGFDGSPTGIGHIWSLPGGGGGDRDHDWD